METLSRYEQYREAVDRERASEPYLREGQAAFNVLWDMERDLAKAMIGDVDPFYDDGQLPAFYAAVKSALDDKPFSPADLLQPFRDVRLHETEIGVLSDWSAMNDVQYLTIWRDADGIAWVRGLISSPYRLTGESK